MRIKELNQDELSVLKKKELEILKYIDSVCMKKGIKYSLAAGTLLGAVRHKGFIPWDDDIDIMMPREDYNIFLRNRDGFYKDGYILVEYCNYIEYGMPFAKLMIKNTRIVEKNTSKAKSPKGVFIDIFPVDKAPCNDEERKYLFDSIRTIKKKILCRSNYYWDKGIVFDSLYKMKGITLKFIPKKYYIDKINEKLQTSHSALDFCYISYMGDVPFEKSTYKKEWFSEYIEIEFEGCMFKAINGYKELLSLQYGDYMKLPPKELQVPHHLVVEFSI